MTEINVIVRELRIPSGNKA